MCVLMCVFGGSGIKARHQHAHTHTYMAGLFCFCAVLSPNRAFVKDATMAGNALTTVGKAFVISTTGASNDLYV